MQDQTQMEQSKEASKRTAIDPIVLSAGASVLLSWFYFYGKGEPEKGLFVGLWPPTLLAFASYFRQTRMHTMLEQQSTGIVRRVQKALQEKQQQRQG